MCHRAVLALLLAAALAGSGCRGPFAKQYEYEEEIYLDLDGTADIVINASIAALVVLHGLPLDPDPQARVDRDAVRAAYETINTHVTRVSRPWRRLGRRFVQIRLSVDDIRKLNRARAFAWATVAFGREGESIVFKETISGPAVRHLPAAGWDGSELVDFRLHLPSKIQEHNTPSRRVERGNILVWEQPLRDRIAGTPLNIAARMEPESILYRTLSIFGLAFLTAMIVLGGAIWWVMRRPIDDGASKV